MYERLLRFASSIEGVVGASLTQSLPLETPRSGGTWIIGQPDTGKTRPTTYISRVPVSPGYMEVLGIRMVSGRTFDAADIVNERRVVVLSVGLAKALWRDRNPLGRMVAFQESSSPRPPTWYEVVGISPDKPAKLAKFREKDSLQITLASDEDKSVMKAYGAFGEKKLYGKIVEGVIRSTFVVDEQGKVEVAQYNVKATGHVAKLRRDLGLD